MAFASFEMVSADNEAARQNVPDGAQRKSTMTLRFSPRSGFSPVARALANS
jgi:hypothetical protein